MADQSLRYLQPDEAAPNCLRDDAACITHGIGIANIAPDGNRAIDFYGFSLKAGDRVLLSEVSACHDEKRFANATSFQPQRDSNKHLAFGIGVHRCVGLHLARMEFATMLRAVLERIPDYELVTVREYPSWAAIGGWAEISVRLP